MQLLPVPVPGLRGYPGSDPDPDPGSGPNPGPGSGPAAPPCGEPEGGGPAPLALPPAPPERAARAAPSRAAPWLRPLPPRARSFRSRPFRRHVAAARACGEGTGGAIFVEGGRGTRAGSGAGTGAGPGLSPASRSSTSPAVPCPHTHGHPSFRTRRAGRPECKSFMLCSRIFPFLEEFVKCLSLTRPLCRSPLLPAKEKTWVHPRPDP